MDVNDSVAVGVYAVGRVLRVDQVWSEVINLAVPNAVGEVPVIAERGRERRHISGIPREADEERTRENYESE